MEEIGIAEFAQRSRLSLKALRLYDELGVSVPSRVNAASGYRYCDVDEAGAWALGKEFGRSRLGYDVVLTRKGGSGCQGQACDQTARYRATMGCNQVIPPDQGN